MAKLRQRLAKIRKADGGIAPNYNNPSQVHKPSKIRKKKTKTAARSPVNKAVNRVNVIKPTKAYKNPPQGPNPDAQTPEAIRKNAEVVGRNNASYIGKIKKKKKKSIGNRGLGEGDMYVERNLPPGHGDFFGTWDENEYLGEPSEEEKIYHGIKKRIARIRKAGEQIDPRVKKRKTVRPDSPVQKVSQLRDRVTEMKTAKEHNHKIEFKSFEGSQYRRASLTKQEGKYAKYWLLNAKQTNGYGCSNCSPYSDSGIHCFAVITNGRPINLCMFFAIEVRDTPHPLPLVCLAFNNQYFAYLPSCLVRLALL